MHRRIPLFALVALTALAPACESTGSAQSTEASTDERKTPPESASPTVSTGEQVQPADGGPVRVDAGENLAVATFAGGCFWCMEPPFEKLDGVKSVVSGFCGGEKEDPGYREVATGQTKYTETVQITYDPETISYDELLDVYWRNIDPTDDEGQFVDRGSQYRPEIFYHDDRQKELAEESKRELAESGPFDEPIVVDITPATRFWAAKDYHQDFYKTHTKRYQSYRRGSGRDEFIDKHWGEK